MSTPWRRRFDTIAPYLVVIIGALAVFAILSTYANGRADTARQDASIQRNTEDAVTQCENGNESREAARALWNFVADLSVAGHPDPSPEQQRFVVEFRDYVNKVYQPHDCDDLSKKYPLPTPPKIPTPAP